MDIEAIVGRATAKLRLLLTRWRFRRALRTRARTLQQELEGLEELLEGGRRRLESAAEVAAFAEMLERELEGVPGIGPKLAERVRSHALVEDAGSFRASVERVDGIGPRRRERLLAWERESRERRRERSRELRRRGGLDPELEAKLAALEERRSRLHAALRRLEAAAQALQALRAPPASGSGSRDAGPDVR